MGPRWSPDGRTIVYALQNTDWRGGLFVIPATRGTSHEILRFESAGGNLVWQPLRSRR